MELIKDSSILKENMHTLENYNKGLQESNQEMASSKNLYKSLNDKLLLNKNEISNLQNELMTHKNMNKELN